MSAEFWIKSLQLLKHPEGGYYKETYRSPEQIDNSALPERFNGSRSFSTGIYFLLNSSEFSAFHRIQSDEMWHFYSGSSLHVYVIDPSGKMKTLKLGSDYENGEVFQAVVQAGCWFASRVNDLRADAYSLVGCTVAPGFDFKDFEMADRSKLTQEFPQYKDLIESLTRL